MEEDEAWTLWDDGGYRAWHTILERIRLYTHYYITRNQIHDTSINTVALVSKTFKQHSTRNIVRRFS